MDNPNLTHLSIEISTNDAIKEDLNRITRHVLYELTAINADSAEELQKLSYNP